MFMSQDKPDHDWQAIRLACEFGATLDKAGFRVSREIAEALKPMAGPCRSRIL